MAAEKNKIVKICKAKSVAEEVETVCEGKEKTGVSKSDTDPSAFLSPNRAAAAASFFRFSSSFTFLS